MRILVINPIGTDRWDEEDRRFYRHFASPDTQIDVMSLPEGPHSLEKREAKEAVVPLIKETAHDHCKEYDCIIVNCFLDPAVNDLRREGILAVGPGEASLAISSFVGKKVAILSISESVEMIGDLVSACGFEMDAVVEPLEISVADISERVSDTVRVIEEKIGSMKGFDVFVLGCTEFTKIVKKIGVNELLITPIPAAVALAECLGRVVYEHR
jgi:allantoin racemase